MGNMLFVGDSFTWGEGLELYIDREPYISARKREMTDLELRELTNDYTNKEVEEFRVKNRFASYIKNYEVYVQSHNGGSYGTIIKDILQITKDNNFKKDDKIIIQIPPMDRSYWFFSFTGNGKVVTGHESDGVPWNEIESEKEIGKLNFMFKKLGIKEKEFFKDPQMYLNELAFRNLKLFYYFYVWELMKLYDVYFIGPHDKSKKVWSKCEEYKSRTIILDGKRISIEGVCKSREGLVISDDFPATKNHHPNLKLHKIIGESIIIHFSQGITAPYQGFY